MGYTRREGRMDVGNQSALSSWFEKYHIGLPQPVADRKQVL